MIDLNSIVEILYNELDQKDIEVLKDCKKFDGKYGIEFHMTAGMDIRNRFKLWEEGVCGDAHPDDISAEILHRLICKVKQEDPNE